jgi:hypothetical protein
LKPLGTAEGREKCNTTYFFFLIFSEELKENWSFDLCPQNKDFK